MDEKIQRYAIRKLTVGAASVLIGVGFMAGNSGHTVKADTIDNNNANTEIVQNSMNTNSNGPIEKYERATLTDATDTNQNQTPVSVKKESDISGLNNQSISTNPDILAKNINIKPDANDQTKINAIKAKALMQNNVNAKVFTENKTEIAVLDYTPAIDAWSGSVDSLGYYELTGYDASKDSNLQNNGIFSIPNEADFEKAGKSTGGHQVGITRDGIHTIFKANVDKIKDLHFSDTDNQKIKAINSDWSYAFSLSNRSDGYKASNIQRITGNGFDTSNIHTANAMMYQNKIHDISGLASWNVSNITNMFGMLESNQIGDLSALKNWDVSNVTAFDWIFYSNKINDLSPIANWNVSKAVGMPGMFEANQISELTPLTNWRVNNVNNMAYMFYSNKISDLSPIANWNVSKVTSMTGMLEANQIGNLTPLTNWSVNNVNDMAYMFYSNKISDLSPIANWNVSKVTNMTSMFQSNQISDLTPLTNWSVNNVNNMSYMFNNNRINNLNSLKDWNVSKVTNMIGMFQSNQISDLIPLTNWIVNNVNNMSYIFSNNQINDLNPLKDWNVSKVTNMVNMFATNKINNLTPLTNWNVANVTNMSNMFNNNQISDLTPLTNWDTGNVINMSHIFFQNKITDLSSIKNWNVSKITDMSFAFDDNPIKYADFSKWNFSKIIDKSAYGIYYQGKVISVTGLHKIVDSPYCVIYFGDNKTLPDWILDNSKTNNDQTFSNPNHAVIITTDSKFLANPNKAFNNITVADQDGTVYTYQVPVFINADSLNNAKKIIQQDIQTQINKNLPNRTVILNTTKSGNVNDPLNGVAYLANSFYTAEHNTKIEDDYNPAKRTITIVDPGGSTTIYVQTIGYKRDKIIDLVTNAVTYGKYNLDDPTSSYTINGSKQTAKSYIQDGSNIYFAPIKIPVVPGYKAIIKKLNGITSVSYRMLALLKQDSNTIKNMPVSDVKLERLSDLAVVDKKSVVTITPKLMNSNNIYYMIKKNDLDISVPKLEHYEFKLLDAPKGALSFTYNNGVNIYTFTVYLENGKFVLRVKNKNVTRKYIIKNKTNLVKLIKTIIK